MTAGAAASAPDDAVPDDAAPGVDRGIDEDLAHELTFRWSELPSVTADLAGTLGTIRTTPEDFVVEEIPLYEPSGSGSHRYLRVEKVGRTTRDLVLALAGAGVPERSIGVAGLKDKVARTVQWISVPQRFDDAAATLEGLDGVRVVDERRHPNKLGIGHLRGNRFTVVVRDAAPDAPARAAAVAAALRERGVPNYVGPQRFGRFGRNAVDGLRVVRGERVAGGATLARFFVAALQSYLFNALLAERLRDGVFGSVVRGDWARKHDTGGTFEVDDVGAEAPRAAAGAISATLPLYGTRVGRSRWEAGEREDRALGRIALRPEDFAGRGRAPRHLRSTGRRGDRRLSRLFGIGIEVGDGDGLRLAFDLPKGAYATTVLREITKVEVDAPLGDEPDAG